MSYRPLVYTLVPAYHYPHISMLATRQPAPTQQPAPSYVLFDSGHENTSQGWRQPPPTQQPANTDVQIVHLLNEYKGKRNPNTLILSPDGLIKGFESELGQLHELLKTQYDTSRVQSVHANGWDVNAAIPQATEIIRLLDLYNIGQFAIYKHHLNRLAILLAGRSPYVPKNMVTPPPAAGPRNYGAVAWNTRRQSASDWYTTDEGGISV